MLPAVELAVGAVLHPDELAADKTLALFGRAEARDLVAVNALAGRYSRERLLELAVTKDPGFDPAVFADALGVAAASSAQAFADLGVDEPDAARLRDYAAHWRSELTTAPDPGVPGDPTTPDDPAAAPALGKENPVTRPASLDDVLAALDAQEAALGRMEERVGRLEAAAGGTAAGVDLTRQPDVVRDTDYDSERGRQAEQDREAGRSCPRPLTCGVGTRRPVCPGGGERWVGADRAPPRGEHLGRAGTPALPHTVRSTLSRRGERARRHVWRCLDVPASAPFG